MKSINRIATLFVTVFVSLTIVTSLFTLFTKDVKAINPLSTNVSSDIITNTTWTVADSPYILTDIINVNEGVTLTVESDVLVMGQTNTGLFIDGHLEANGTSSNPITFTSVLSSTPGEWYGIVIEETGSVHLNHATVQHGYYNIVVSSSNAPISKIENTHIEFSDLYGISIDDYSLHLTELNNVTFANNNNDRIAIWGNADVVSLVNDVTLSPQPGLGGYEVRFSNVNNNGTIKVPFTTTLAIEPDVTIFLPEAVIEVNGRLEAIGTPTQPITFTSITTDTYSWQGISVYGGDIELKHTNIQRSNGNGLSFLDGTVTAHCSIFADNLGSGIFVDANAQGDIQLAYNSLVSNTVAGLRNENTAWLDTRYTWWGAANGPSGSGSGSGDAVIGNVLYEPWLTESECQDITTVNLEVNQSVMTTIDTLTYTIDITNHSTTTATQLILTDALPSQVTLVDTPAYCTSSSELICDLGELASGTHMSMTIQVQASVTETAVLTNTIDVLAAQLDLDLSLNHSVLTTVVYPEETPRWYIFLPMIVKND